jgi:dihydropteroate synthase
VPLPLYIRETVWDWSRPYLLAVVNVTPDSFSDGGAHCTHEAAVSHALQLISEGADAVDIGGESTRPHAMPVDVREECARTIPVIRALAARTGVPISIDSTKAEVVREALAAGATLVNDVGMGDSPSVLGTLAAHSNAAYIAMHARGTPPTMRSLSSYHNLHAEVCHELSAVADTLLKSGVSRERILLDPGIGFAKTAPQSLALLANLAPLRALGYAVCVGPSRKSFIDAHDAYAPTWTTAETTAHNRVGGTAAAVTLAVLQGAEMLRVHDVAVMRQAARVAHACTRGGGQYV